MLTCLHKYYPLEQLIDFFTHNPASGSTFYTLGIRDDDFDKLKAFVQKAATMARPDLHRCRQRLHQVLCGSGQAGP